MMKDQTFNQFDSCNSKVQSFLNHDWTDGKHDEYERELNRHVATCQTCQNLLDQSTIDSAWWKKAKSYFETDQWDGELHESSLTTPVLVSELSATHGTQTSLHSPVSANIAIETVTHTTEKSDSKTERAIRARQILGLLDPTDDPHMIGRFGGYEIVGVIGQGGMGVVLKGFERSLNRYVAIKVLAPHLASSGAARQRFSREAQAAAAVLHENVIAIHRVDETNGLPFLVMPYVAGPSLQKRLDAEGQLPVLAVLRIGQQVAAGLAAAHQQGLVHRDIKPSNILLERGIERVTITDFGLARACDDASLTHTGMIAGTPQYMSPEQVRAEPLDARSDLFSLGSLLYACLTGRPPFRGETSYGILMRTANERPRSIRDQNPDTPIWLVNLIDRLHQKAPQDRFDSAEQVAKLLGECIAHSQQPDVRAVPVQLSQVLKSNSPAQQIYLVEKKIPDQMIAPTGSFILGFALVLAAAFVSVFAIAIFIYFLRSSSGLQKPPRPVPLTQQAADSQSVPEPIAKESESASGVELVFAQPDEAWIELDQSFETLDRDLEDYLKRTSDEFD
jgi:serine/threonine protein kinase